MISIKGRFEKTNQYNNIWIIYAMIFSSILTPSIKIGALPAFRIEQIIVILSAICILINPMLRKKAWNKTTKFPLMYLGFSLVILLSILVGYFKGIDVIANDFFEIYKIIVYLGIYLITSTIVESKEDKMKIIKFIMICLLISILISVQQYFNLFHLNEKYIPIIAPTQFRTLVDNYPHPRVVGMTPNPNVYALMPGIGAIISWAIFLLTKKIKNLIFMIVFVLGVFMTSSRSGFIFMVSGIIVFTFFYLLKPILNKKTLVKGKINLKSLIAIVVPMLILIVLFIIIFNYLPKDLTWRIIGGFDIKSDNSFQKRLSNWEEHINYFKMSPIFGLGPAKSIEYGSHSDNEWLLFLRRYGVIGCLYIILTFVLPFIRSKDKFFKYIYFSVLAGSALYMIPVAIYHSFQVMPLIMILAGLAFFDEAIIYKKQKTN